MNLFLSYVKIFIKSKVFLFSFLGMIFFCFYQLIDMYVQWPQLLVNPLEVTLKLSKYIFVFFLFLSYEFFYRNKHYNMEEVAAVTKKGVNRKHYGAQFLAVTLFNAIMTLLIILYNIVIFRIIAANQGIKNAMNDYIVHIILCVIIYIFLINILASLIGMFVHKLGNRILGFGLLFLVVFISGSFVETIANTVIDTIGINLFEFRDWFDIFPINLRFVPNPAFGFSILPYKIAIILLWISVFAVCTQLVLNCPYKKQFVCMFLILGIASGIVYKLPASKVIMDNSPDGSAMYDMFHYAGKDYGKEIPAAFKVDKYVLDVSIGFQLESKAILSLSEPALEEYLFTLYHKYKVSRVEDQNGNELPFIQEGDYLKIISKGDATYELCIEYEGAAPAYYSNYQGVYLTGDFPYYPVAGYKVMAEKESGLLLRNYLEEETEFDVTVNYHKSVYSNLKSVGRNHFKGKANGVSIVAGMYHQETKNGNRIILPKYEHYDDARTDLYTLNLLDEAGYEDCTFIVVPNMNQGGSFCNVSEHQIISSTPFFGEGFKSDWMELLKEGKKDDTDF